MGGATIICPNCKKPFEISDAIQHQIEDELIRAKTEQSETLRKEYDAAAEIKLMNVIRQILEYYFMQLCGYDGMNIRKRVLDEHRDKFIVPVESGQPDYTKWHLATAMLSHIGASSVGFSDGLN